MKTQLIILIQLLPFTLFAHDGAPHSHWYDNGSIGLVLIMISVLLASIPLRYAHLIKKKEDKLTNSKKGNVILVNSTARLNFSGFEKKPGEIKYTK